MAAQQTSVDDAQVVAFAGKVETSGITDIRSFVNGEATAEIPFGRMVAHDTADNEVDMMASNADVPAGIAVHSHAYAKDDELGDTGIKPNMVVSVLRRGRVWVNTEDLAGYDDAVRYRCTASGDGAGEFLSADPTGTDTVDISKFARWLSVRSDAGLALLEIDMIGAIHRANDS